MIFKYITTVERCLPFLYLFFFQYFFDVERLVHNERIPICHKWYEFYKNVVGGYVQYTKYTATVLVIVFIIFLALLAPSSIFDGKKKKYFITAKLTMLLFILYHFHKYIYALFYIHYNVLLESYSKISQTYGNELCVLTHSLITIFVFCLLCRIAKHAANEVK